MRRLAATWRGADADFGMEGGIMEAGFIGVGAMGCAMAATLIDAGHHLRASRPAPSDRDWAALANVSRRHGGL